MLQFNEEALSQAIIDKAVDELMARDDEMYARIREKIDRKIDALFADKAVDVIESAIKAAVDNGFEREYQKVDTWGQAVGDKTSLKKEVERITVGYWDTNVDPRSGKPSSSYGAIKRSEYAMVQLCGQGFSEEMAKHLANITGYLKDELRNKLAAHMDQMLSDVFKVRSLQDQGKVEKPWNKPVQTPAIEE